MSGAIERFWNKVDKSGDCWLWTGASDGYGYGNFNFSGRYYKAHRLSYELKHGHISKGLLVCHKCDNPKCVNPDHLFLGSHQDNCNDMHRKGRGRKAAGPSHHMSNIDGAMAKKIIKLYDGGKMRQIDVANRFGVSQTLVSAVVRGVHWTQRGDQPSP